MAIGAPSALRAVPLARSAASARSPSAPAAAVVRASAASTASGSVRLGGAAFLSAGAVGLSARARGADHALARKPVKKRVVAADAAAASADAPTAAADDKAKSLRIGLSITGWFFLNAVFGESSLLQHCVLLPPSVRDSPPTHAQEER